MRLVYALLYCSMRFDISLQNFEKPLVDISPQIKRKTVPKNIFILFWL